MHDAKKQAVEKIFDVEEFLLCALPEVKPLVGNKLNPAQTVFDGASVTVPLLLPVQENISKSEQKPAKETSLCILDIFICVPCQSSFSSPKYCFPSFQKIAYRTPAFSSACMALIRSLPMCISSSGLPFQS